MYEHWLGHKHTLISFTRRNECDIKRSSLSAENRTDGTYPRTLSRIQINECDTQKEFHGLIEVWLASCKRIYEQNIRMLDPTPNTHTHPHTHTHVQPDSSVRSSVFLFISSKYFRPTFVMFWDWRHLESKRMSRVNTVTVCISSTLSRAPHLIVHSNYVWKSGGV